LPTMSTGVPAAAKIWIFSYLAASPPETAGNNWTWAFEWPSFHCLRNAWYCACVTESDWSNMKVSTPGVPTLIEAVVAAVVAACAPAALLVVAAWTAEVPVALLVLAAVVPAALAACAAVLATLAVEAGADVVAPVLALAVTAAVLLARVAPPVPPQAARGATIATPPAAKRKRSASRRECRELP
jgi:hypothetical protein